MSEFQRMGDLRQIDTAPLHLVASAEECAALARRFALVSVDRLEADLALERDGAVVTANGRMTAAIVQTCAVSGEDLPVAIDEPLSFRFVPEGQSATPDEEIELDEDACDDIPYSGTSFDLGEAVAQSLALAIDPYAVGPDAEAARAAAGIIGESESGPFAALAALKDKKEK